MIVILSITVIINAMFGFTPYTNWHDEKSHHICQEFFLFNAHCKAVATGVLRSSSNIFSRQRSTTAFLLLQSQFFNGLSVTVFIIVIVRFAHIWDMCHMYIISASDFGSSNTWSCSCLHIKVDYSNGLFIAFNAC